MSNWPVAVDRVVDGVTSFSSDSLGVIIDALTARTDWLKKDSDTRKENFKGNRGFSFYDTGFSPDCKKGMLVAWDTGLGVYIPALAAGTGTYRDDGTEIAADSANVVGVLTDVNPTTTGGTVLCCGYINDPEVLTELIGEAGSSGNYYLSSTDPGTAYHAPASDNPMSPYCFTALYSTNDKNPAVFVRPYPPAYNGTSEVRSVSVDDKSNMMTAETVKGAVKLKLNTDLVESSDISGRALVGVSSDGFLTNPVINEILPGAGVVIAKQSPGVVSVSSETVLNSEYDLNLCALDGVYVGTSNTNGVVYTFPTGVSAALTGVIRVPNLGETKVKSTASILLEGTGNSSGLSELSVTVQSTAESVNTKAVPVVYPIPAVSAHDSSKVYKVLINIDQPMASGDIVYLKLRSLSPATTTKVLAVSIKFTEVVDEQ